jgi:hypothetical protein
MGRQIEELARFAARAPAFDYAFDPRDPAVTQDGAVSAGEPVMRFAPCSSRSETRWSLRSRRMAKVRPNGLSCLNDGIGSVSQQSGRGIWRAPVRTSTLS